MSDILWAEWLRKSKCACRPWVHCRVSLICLPVHCWQFLIRVSFLHNTSRRGDQSLHLTAHDMRSIWLIDWHRWNNSVDWMWAHHLVATMRRPLWLRQLCVAAWEGEQYVRVGALLEALWGTRVTAGEIVFCSIEAGVLTVAAKYAVAENSVYFLLF